MFNRAPNKNNNVRPRRTVQSLGGHTYAIPEAAGEERTLTMRMIPYMGLVFFPLSISFLVLFTGFMIFSPISWRHSLLTCLIPSQMKVVQRMTTNQRKLLLQHVSGRVLDVGSGSGPYMSLLSGKATHVVALEPVRTMHPFIRKEAEKAGFKDYKITISDLTIENYAAANPTSLASFDWIILGNVLCEVKDQESTLNTVHKLLKHGGHVYFSEHVASPAKTFERRMQQFINPWWRRVSGGCNRDRDSLHAIEGMADWDVISWEMKNITLPFGGPFVMGLARKEAANTV
ncbi:methyltransferase domain-containing protein [Fragilaria crotonensis]|nr:methyltransferase domain-containing protein [Fragilaria crotonensis]